MLSSKVDYVAGQIAKEVIISNDSGIVIEMAFDKGCELPTHVAQADVLVQILEGEMDFTIEGEVHHLKAGQFITMKPNTHHSLKAVERFKMLLTKLNVK